MRLIELFAQQKYFAGLADKTTGFMGAYSFESRALQIKDGDIRSRLVQARPNGPAVREYGPLCEIEDCRLANPPRISDAERRYPGGFPKEAARA